MRISPVDENAEAQIEALEEAGAKQVFVDRVPAAKARPELERCIKQARSGDTLLVWSITRLGRSLSHLMRLAEDLQSRGIVLRSLSEDLEKFSEAIAVLRLCDRSMRSERSLIASAEHGTRASRWGRPGFFQKPELVAEAKRLLSDNTLSRAEVAKQLGVSQATLYRWLPIAGEGRRKGGRPRKNQSKAATPQGEGL